MSKLECGELSLKGFDKKDQKIDNSLDQQVPLQYSNYDLVTNSNDASKDDNDFNHLNLPQLSP